MSKDLFVLAGNSSYMNRGCEAIVRGTTRIIRCYYEAPAFVSIGFFRNSEQYREQQKNEVDSSIVHMQARPIRRRYSPYWFLHKALRVSMPGLRGRLIYNRMLPALRDARAVLSVGGDNYSLDYCKPDQFTMLDELVLARKKNIVIWGASVGPFSAMPEYERYMIDHLKKVTGIFVRETLSLEYLASKGVRHNVFLVADPAFLLDAVEPAEAPTIEDEAIGVNLSPLMAKYVTNGDVHQWRRVAARMVRQMAVSSGRKIYLVPHVTQQANCDHTFLKDVLAQLSDIEIQLIPGCYNAAETKWIIGKMAAFVGARTHATIAAMSMGVPTLSIVYSMKARGINRDIFGDERFCVMSHEVAPTAMTDRMLALLADRATVRDWLVGRMPEISRMAQLAGARLAEICPPAG